MGSEQQLSLRGPGQWEAVPGEIITVYPHKRWSYAGHSYLSGEIARSRLDLALLGLVPLALHPQGTWEPADLRLEGRIRAAPGLGARHPARGLRPTFEMEQVLPGYGPDELDWLR